MYPEENIKIAGDKPSVDVKRNKALEEVGGVDSITVLNAEKWGRRVAELFIEESANTVELQELTDSSAVIQRKMLLAFTATVGFEQFAAGNTVCAVAKQSFSDAVEAADGELYRISNDLCAFSFYYLAFRRRVEVERRIGQTFAMLCSYDGDPIHQEIGETVYCRFLSVVEKAAKDCKII